jgi:hypothetical protein
MTIKTNNVPRDVVEAYELTAEERAEFDYLDWAAIDEGRDSASFVRFKGELYDLGEFEAIDPQRIATHQGSELSAWHACRTDSYFSGLVIRFPPNDTDGEPDYERVVVGLYLT